LPLIRISVGRPFSKWASGSSAGFDTLNIAAIAAPCSTTDKTRFRGDGPEYTYTILNRLSHSHVELPQFRAQTRAFC